MTDINDPVSLTGISSLVNRGHVNNKIDLLKTEKKSIGNRKMHTIVEKDPANEFKVFIDDLYEQVGIDPENKKTKSNRSKHSGRSEHSEESDEDKSRSESDDSRSDSDSRSERSDDSRSDSESDSRSERSDDSRSRSDDSRSRSGSDRSRSDSDSDRSRSSRSGSDSSRSSRDKRKDRHKKRKLNRKMKQAIQSYSGYDLDEMDNLKAEMLNDIDELKNELVSDGIDITRLPEPTEESDIADVKKLHTKLRLKYDRIRCHGFANEIILAGAQFLGTVFNGRRKIGPYSPDLVGWHNTVRPKLRRIKYETSSLMANLVGSDKIGPGLRIALELIPSAFVYSNMRKDQHGQDSYTPDQLSEAFHDLSKFDT